MDIKIKQCKSEDYETAYVLIKELIEFHNALNIFELTPMRIKELIENEEIISLIAYADDEPAGIMNCFFKYYTTYTGRSILYIEDLYTRSRFRSNGIGRSLFEKAKEIAVTKSCEKIELKCAQWNVRSAEFYESLGMNADKDWVTYTLDKSLF